MQKKRRKILSYRIKGRQQTEKQCFKKWEISDLVVMVTITLNSEDSLQHVSVKKAIRQMNRKKLKSKISICRFRILKESALCRSRLKRLQQSQSAQMILQQKLKGFQQIHNNLKYRYLWLPNLLQRNYLQIVRMRNSQQATLLSSRLKILAKRQMSRLRMRVLPKLKLLLMILKLQKLKSLVSVQTCR